MNDLTLVYFKMRALGEAPQMMLRYRHQPCQYRMGWDYFGKPWADAKRSAAFRQLPMLVTEDGVAITQTGAVMRYLARRLDLIPADPATAALADEIFEGAHELFAQFDPVVNFHTGDQFRASKEACLPLLQNRFADFELLLARHGGPFSLGGALISVTLPLSVIWISRISSMRSFWRTIRFYRISWQPCAGFPGLAPILPTGRN